MDGNGKRKVEGKLKRAECVHVVTDSVGALLLADFSIFVSASSICLLLACCSEDEQDMKS